MQLQSTFSDKLKFLRQMMIWHSIRAEILNLNFVSFIYFSFQLNILHVQALPIKKELKFD